MDPDRKMDEHRLRRLAQGLIDAQESERHRLARLMHDDLGQALTALKLTLATPGLSRGGPESEAALGEARDMVAALLESARELTVDLRPSMLDDLGLRETLDWYLNKRSREEGFQLDLRLDGLDPALPPRLQTACFRVVQEALANGGPAGIRESVAVRTRRSGDRLALEILRDGLDAASWRNVLHGTEERLMLLGGCLEIEAAAGGGARLRAELPLEAADPKEDKGT